MEKMPSASNSPVIQRRRNSRISSLAQEQEQTSGQVQTATVSAVAALKTGNPLLDKLSKQTSVASMVQRFERDTSLDRKTRAGSVDAAAPAGGAIRKWAAGVSAGRTTTTLSSRSSSLSSAEAGPVVSKKSVPAAVKKSVKTSSAAAVTVRSVSAPKAPTSTPRAGASARNRASVTSPATGVGGTSVGRKSVATPVSQTSPFVNQSIQYFLYLTAYCILVH